VLFLGARSAADCPRRLRRTSGRMGSDRSTVGRPSGFVKDLTDHRPALDLREAKLMQIFEGSNQPQRMVISRELAKSLGGNISHTG